MRLVFVLSIDIFIMLQPCHQVISVYLTCVRLRTSLQFCHYVSTCNNSDVAFFGLGLDCQK